MRTGKTWLFIIGAALLVLPGLLPAAGCGGDNARASRLVQEANGLRVSVADRFRQTTAAMDSLVQGAAGGHALPPNQTKDAAQAATANLQAALDELSLRDGKLKDAQQLNLSTDWQDYLTLLIQSNDKLTASISMSLQIPRLLESEQYSLAGWDELRTQTVIKQIRDMQQLIQQTYADSESLRQQAEQRKQDNPQAFS
ncbi:MAG: hypothetical protein ACYCXF_08130 [Thermoleophilia bacterium]